MSGAMFKPKSGIWRDIVLSARRLRDDCRGLAATEFALIVPLMLVAFFGTVEFSSAVAVNRKVTIMANTLANLTAQYQSVADTDLTNFFAAALGVMTPYSTTPLQTTISELWIDPATSNARVQWSSGTSPRAAGTTVSISSNLIVKDANGHAVANQYLIYAEVSYLYTPTIGYVMAKSGVNLSDVGLTRPRQTTCVIYPTPAAGAAVPACPTS
jgi:Flp pilus assembly protein TadG